MERLQEKTVKNMEDKEKGLWNNCQRRRKMENMFGSSLLLFIIASIFRCSDCGSTDNYEWRYRHS